MAAGLKRDHVVILRIVGEDLHEFVTTPTFEPETLSILLELESSDGSLKQYIINAFEKLSVDQGIPPVTDPWAVSNILEPALQPFNNVLQSPVSPETFLSKLTRIADNVV